jgi:hypothetical protein
MSLRLTMALMVMLAFTPPHWGQQVAPCTFNSMCSCKFGGGETRGIHFTTPKSLESVKDISCVGVPFSKLPGNISSVTGNMFSQTQHLNYNV